LARGRRRDTTADEHTSLWRRFRRNLSLSLAAAVMALGIKACQTLLLTRTLRLEDYGRVLIVINLLTLLNSFIGLRVSDLMFRFFPTLRDSRNKDAMQALLLLSMAISAGTGLIIVSGIWLLAPWLAEKLCQNRALAPLFMIYGCTALFLSFAEVYAPILRIHDRFKTLVVPQVIGSLTTLVLLIAYIARTGRHSLTVIVAAFTVGVIVQSVPPLACSLHLVRPYLRDIRVRKAFGALAAYRSELLRCLFNSNISGYIKIAVSPGDIFLLGAFGSPAQVALYGVAKQLIAPPALLLTNVHTALTPEVALLVAQRNIPQLKRLIVRYFRFVALMGAALTIGSFLIGRVVVVWISKPEYAASLPVFYVLLFATWALLFTAIARPLALSFDLLKWDNITQLATTALLFAVIAAGRLDAWTMALVQLISAVVLRAIFSAPVWMKLRAGALPRAFEDRLRDTS
jgi:O-antigen/teichoic acid export membrane protein